MKFSPTFFPLVAPVVLHVVLGAFGHEVNHIVRDLAAEVVFDRSLSPVPQMLVPVGGEAVRRGYTPGVTYMVLITHFR